MTSSVKGGEPLGTGAIPVCIVPDPQSASPPQRKGFWERANNSAQAGIDGGIERAVSTSLYEFLRGVARVTLDKTRQCLKLDRPKIEDEKFLLAMCRKDCGGLPADDKTVEKAIRILQKVKEDDPQFYPFYKEHYHKCFGERSTKTS